MLSLNTMSNWLSRDRNPKVSSDDKVAFSSLVTMHQQSFQEARIAKFGDESGYRLGRSRRQFLQAASGIAAVFFGINRVCGQAFEVHKPEATASWQSHDAPLDLTRFTAEHWNPLMLEELYFEQKRFK